MEVKLAVLVVLLSSLVTAEVEVTRLKADGSDDTYSHINEVFGGGQEDDIEVPDCSHESFGPHISQRYDAELTTFVFVFHIHRHPDNDRCKKIDRQRTEIKPYGPSSMTGSQDSKGLKYTWKFKLDMGFQASTGFCHIHEIKAVGGDDTAMPIITLTPRRNGTKQFLELIHIDRKQMWRRLKAVDLSLISGIWVQAREELVLGPDALYTIELSRVLDKHILFSYTGHLDLWRDSAEFVRPKWGIYRSLTGQGALRDEDILFDDFCLAKGDYNELYEYCRDDPALFPEA